MNIVQSIAFIISGQTTDEEKKNLNLFKNLLNQLYACLDAVMTRAEQKVEEKLNLMADNDDYDDGEEEEEVIEENILQQQQQQTAQTSPEVQALIQNRQVLEAITQVIEG